MDSCSAYGFVATDASPVFHSLLGPKRHVPSRDIHELFHDQANRNPGLSAVASEPSDELHKLVEDGFVDPSSAYHLSYGELKERAWAVAAEIRLRQPRGSRHSGETLLVAVCLQRTPALVVALLGTLAAGAAYVPLEPTHPGARLRFILDDSRAELLITCWCARRRGLLPDDRLVRVAAIDGRLIPSRASPPEGPASEDEGAVRDPLERAAYLIYTSGSTGTPKGVLVARRGVVNVLHAFDAQLRRPNRGAVLAAVTTYCFDISVLEIFWPLCFGFGLFLVSSLTARNGVKLRAVLEEQHASVLQGTPAMWRSLLRAAWPGREGLVAICGGEAFPPALAAPLLQCAAGGVWNAYGPTEATIWATAHRLGSTDALPSPAGPCMVPIGAPLPNTELLIEAVDAGHDVEMQEQWRAQSLSSTDTVPVNVGELYIGGAGVALGYHGRPELSATCFVPRPRGAGGRTGPCASCTVYRTGDLVKLRPDGELEFLGRRDQQVKFRGFRVELGEIETVLEQHRGVDAAVLVLSQGRPGLRGGDDDGAQLLAAFVVQSADEPEQHAGADTTGTSSFPSSESGLRAYLASRLPAYMVPQRMVFVPRLPLTNSGKVDRIVLAQGLAEDLKSRGEKTAGDGDKVAGGGIGARPVSAPTKQDAHPLQQRVAALLSSAVGLDLAMRPGAEDSPLSALGMDSASAVAAAEALAAGLPGGRVEVPVELLLADGSLAALCAHLEGLGSRGPWGSP